jgi:hypothetical protein
VSGLNPSQRIALAVLPGQGESLDDLAYLGGGDLGGVVIRAESLRVQDLRP